MNTCTLSIFVNAQLILVFHKKYITHDAGNHIQIFRPVMIFFVGFQFKLSAAKLAPVQ